MGQDLAVTESLMILTADGGLSCQSHFGYYDAGRDAVMLWLEPLEATEEQNVTLGEIFESSTIPAVSFHHYLVFSFSDLRIGCMVRDDTDKLVNLRPQHLSVGARDAIFDAGGFPKPE
ncbi:MAG TPA: hypothetical protein VM581_03980 [Magnetospirillaceae bacterium]|nr:hypothetical protein [Magnetospirillaceae bacterium]